MDEFGTVRILLAEFPAVAIVLPATTAGLPSGYLDRCDFWITGGQDAAPIDDRLCQE
ncbi:hypothetical protein EMEDMD4_90215 [Sinorhizobium medicae]|uniref:Uncharacterized protein n=1 Tax=Sinorhizobium medicae TaxID=110321 RepID=A0A508X7I4_9HYPH|nr:hypothetical protein EMEDMD4_90215 [Sinorhizobium medicae]